jgi:ArsR family transcriptional regulator
MNDRRKDSSCCTPERNAAQVPSLASQAGEAELASLAKALGHPARVRILRILLARETCVCGEIVAELPLAQATVSQHLKVLRENGLVQGEIDGPRVCYCVDRARLTVLAGLIGQLADESRDHPVQEAMEVMA